MKIGNIAARRTVIIIIFLLCSVDLTLGGELTPKQNVFQNELIKRMDQMSFILKKKECCTGLLFQMRNRFL